jgi:hypothetical protein
VQLNALAMGSSTSIVSSDRFIPPRRPPGHDDGVRPSGNWAVLPALSVGDLDARLGSAERWSKSSGSRRTVDAGAGSGLRSIAFRLRAIHRTCAAPDCPVRFDDWHIHHLKEWGDGGMTNLENLRPLCSRRHHLVHEVRWQPPARAPAA